MKINIIIPFYNQQDVLTRHLKDIQRWYSLNFKPKFDIGLFFVNDGSTDNSELVLKNLSHKIKLPITILGYKTHIGYDWAWRYGVSNSSKANYYYLQPLELVEDVRELYNLIKEVKKQDADCILGYNDLEVENLKSRVINWCVNNILKLKTTKFKYILVSRSCVNAFRESLDRYIKNKFTVLFLLKKRGMKMLKVKSDSAIPAERVNFIELIKIRFNL